MKPMPPAWALAAGLPAPRASEDFTRYVLRLGLDPSPLLEGLTERSAECANVRLASLIARSMPRQYHAHVEALARAHISEERRRELHSFRF